MPRLCRAAQCAGGAAVALTRWLCVRFLHLALDRISPIPTQPFAVLDGALNRRLIWQANAPAMALGIRSGQSLTQAGALCGDLQTGLRSLAGELQTLQQLAAWAYQYSHEVVLEAPQTQLLLELGRSVKLFGETLRPRILQELKALGFAVRLGSGKTPAAARAAAFAAQDMRFEQLKGRLPLRWSALPIAVVDVLAASGIHTLDALIALPRDSLAQRFGPCVGLTLDRLSGTAPEPLLYFVPPESLALALPLPGPTKHTEMLLFGLKRLLALLCAQLRARDLAIQQLILVLSLERMHQSSINTDKRSADDTLTLHLELGSISRDPEFLLSLWRIRLERVQLAQPALEMQLQAPKLLPFHTQARDLFDTRRNAETDLPQLLARLRARLGDAALRTLVLHSEHRPEQRSIYSAPLQAKLSQAKPTKPKLASQHAQTQLDLRGQTQSAAIPHDFGAQQAFWLHAKPQAIHPEDFQIISGPERIESGWWDDHDLRRDYFRAQNTEGCGCWIYRDLKTDSWFWHGNLY